jgi:hypothetical protein
LALDKQTGRKGAGTSAKRATAYSISAFDTAIAITAALIFISILELFNESILRPESLLKMK